MSSEIANLPNDNIDSIGKYGTLETQEIPTNSSSNSTTDSNDAGMTSNSTTDVATTDSNDAGMTSNDRQQTEIVKIKKMQRTKHSSMKSLNNPLTIAREKTIKEGTPLMVNFDERVVVHTVPYWDPCGETFYDQEDDDGPRGPNCCIVL